MEPGDDDVFFLRGTDSFDDNLRFCFCLGVPRFDVVDAAGADDDGNGEECEGIMCA
jgi:hypothetical protein